MMWMRNTLMEYYMKWYHNMSERYSAEVPEVDLFKYSSDTDYEKTHASLSMKYKEMKLRSQLWYEFVSKYLTKYNKCVNQYKSG